MLSLYQTASVYVSCNYYYTFFFHGKYINYIYFKLFKLTRKFIEIISSR